MLRPSLVIQETHAGFRILSHPIFSTLLLAQRHAVKLIKQSSPVISQHLAVLDPLLGPVLVPAADVVLCLLEVKQLVPDTLADENGAIVLLDNALLVL
jgi:hypothetical protein